MGVGKMGEGDGKNLSCGGTVMKWIFMIVNFIVLLVGSAILGVSLWIKFDTNTSQYLDVINYEAKRPYFEYALYMLMAVGGLLLLISLFGCCGAVKESAGIFCSYAFKLILMFILVIAGVVLIIFFSNDLESNLKDTLANQAQKEVCQEGNELRKAWDNIQTTFKCCGGDNYTDYDGLKCNNGSITFDVPSSCCTKENGIDLLLKCPAGEKVYKEGCYDAIRNWISGQGFILIGIGGSLLFMLLLAIILACCLRSDINNGENTA